MVIEIFSLQKCLVLKDQLCVRFVTNLTLLHIELLRMVRSEISSLAQLTVILLPTFCQSLCNFSRMMWSYFIGAVTTL